MLAPPIEAEHDQPLDTPPEERASYDPHLSPEKRFEAVMDIAQHTDADAIDELIAAAQDPDVFVRLQAVRSLGVLDSPDVKKVLQSVVEGDSVPVVRQTAQEGLDRMEN